MFDITLRRLVGRGMDLATFVAQEIDRIGLRPMHAKTGVAVTTLGHIARREIKTLPEIDTLDRIAQAYNLPLWRVMEMAAIDLGLTKGDREQADRIASLARAFPGLMPAILEGLLDLDPADYQGVLAYIEMQRQLRQPRRSDESTDQ